MRHAHTPLAVACAALLVRGAAAQETSVLAIERAESPAAIAVERSGGHAYVAASALEGLGWSVATGTRRLAAVYRGDTLQIEAGSPFLLWQKQLYQLAEPPYLDQGELRIPLQLLVDWLPAVLGGSFAYDLETRVLRVSPASDGVGASPGRDAEIERASFSARHSRLVVVDPGHGGSDPGAVGRLGVREKDVALRIALQLAEELRRDSTIEVRLTRARDVLVPLWERGDRATSWRENRPSVFVSVHVNSLPTARSTRGFETYFLSEARTEHERRVAAIENAALGPQREPASNGDRGLTFILKELVKLDHQHWSSLLAELVQRHLAGVHPGPNRGVKQAPLAVVTNALMPAVLVEMGFISNRAEEGLMRDARFQREAAVGLAAAIRTFFQRYPPGQTVR